MSTTEPEELTIETCEDLEDAIQEIGRLQTELDKKENEQTIEVRKVKRHYKPMLERRQEKLERFERTALEYCREHRDELLDGNSKTAKLMTGDIQFKKGRPKIVYRDDKDTIIQRLKEAGHDDLVVMKPKLYKKTLMKHWKDIEGIKGLERQDGEERIKIKPMAA